MAADLILANNADNEHALKLLLELPAEVRCALSHQHYNDLAVCNACAERDQFVSDTMHSAYLHTDEGVDVRRIFDALHPHVIKNLNEWFKGSFDAHGQVPTKGLTNTHSWALGATLSLSTHAVVSA